MPTALLLPYSPPRFSDLPTALHTCIIDRIGNKSKWVLKMKKEFDPGVKVNSKKKSFKHAKSFEKHLISLTNLFIFISHWKRRNIRKKCVIQHIHWGNEVRTLNPAYFLRHKIPKQKELKGKWDFVTKIVLTNSEKKLF